MHELSMMENVLDLVIDFAEKNDAKEIVRINMVIGAVSNIIPKWTMLFFEMIAKGTIAEKADLKFEIYPAYVKCRACGSESKIKIDPPVFLCNSCGSDNVQLLTGREFQIKSIEII